MNHNLTKEEETAIKSLKRLAKKWPKSLWLYNNGDMVVMRKNSKGNIAMAADNIGFDQDYQICIIDIHSEGGDW